MGGGPTARVVAVCFRSCPLQCRSLRACTVLESSRHLCQQNQNPSYRACKHRSYQQRWRHAAHSIIRGPRSSRHVPENHTIRDNEHRNGMQASRPCVLPASSDSKAEISVGFVDSQPLDLGSLEVEIDDGVIQELQALQAAEVLRGHLHTAATGIQREHAAKALQSKTFHHTESIPH